MHVPWRGDPTVNLVWDEPHPSGVGSHIEPVLFPQWPRRQPQPELGRWGIGWSAAKPTVSPAGAPKLPVLPSLSPEKPSAFSQELVDASVTEGEDLTLVCETVTPDSPVCWTKDGKVLRSSARCRLTYEGRQAQLVITGATLQDGGRYKCEAGGAWSSSIVRVHGEPPGGAHVSARSGEGPGDPICLPLSLWGGGVYQLLVPLSL